MTLVPDGLRPGGRIDDWQPDGRAVAWIASDVDGTVLGSDDAVVAANADALLAAVDAGLAAGFVTGRMRNGVDRIHDRAPLPGPHVVFNGAEVRHEQVTIASWPLTTDEVLALLALCREQHAYGEFYTSDDYWITRTDERAEEHWATLGRMPVGLITPDTIPDHPIVKATLIGFGDDETQRLHPAIKQLGLVVGDGRSLAHPTWSYLNATRPGVTKAKAIRAAADHLGIGLDQVLMIGDGHNDIPAMEVVGTAVAMGNARDEVKQVAHLVTTTVDDGGLAHALQALGLV